MKTFIVILTIFSTVVGVLGDSSDCSMECPDESSPTCGTDGSVFRQFDNDCLLNVFNCERRSSSLRAYRKMDLEWCTTTEITEHKWDISDDERENADPSCMKICPMYYDPVCGSNGTYRRVFDNECMLDLYNCYRGSNDNSYRILQRRGCRVSVRSGR